MCSFRSHSDAGERDRATHELLAAGVQATNLYPPLAPFFPEARNPRIQDFPVAADLHERIINLPLWPQSPVWTNA